MIVDLAEQGVGAVLLDIEGTTTPIAFVSQVLFPFARAHLRAFLQSARHTEELAAIVRLLRAEHAADAAGPDQPPEWPAANAPVSEAALLAYLEWLMDRDRKSPGLKRLQGLIWERGYQAGELRGDVFADVPPAIRRWRAAGIDVAIYSSGSVLAQRRLFESTEHGDLTPLLAGFFDTAVGAKTSSESYRRVAQAMGHAPGRILFISDVVAELSAARAAGLQVVLSLRPGNAPQPHAGDWPAIHSFDEVVSQAPGHNGRGDF